MDNKKNELILNFLLVISEMYGKEISKPMGKVYLDSFEKYDYKTLDKAFKKVLSTCKFFPKPVEILEIISGTKSDKSLTAWMVVHDAIRSYGYYSSIDFGDPLIVKAIAQLGGWGKLCRTNTNEMVWMQKEFERIYQNLLLSVNKGGSTVVVGLFEKHNLLHNKLDAIPSAVKVGIAKQEELKKLEDKK